MLEGLGQEMEGLRCLPLIGGKQVPVDGGCVSTGAHLINCTPGWSRDLIEEGYIGMLQAWPQNSVELDSLPCPLVCDCM